MQQRNEARLVLNLPLPATIQSGPKMLTKGSILDLSPRGMLLRLEKPVERLTNIDIESSELALSGCVLRCTQAEGGYLAGVRLYHRLDRIDQLRRLNKLLERGTEIGQMIVPSWRARLAAH